jgi:fumarate reductase (CoM/CoB) subunit B
MSEDRAKLTIFRYNPEEDESPYYEVYEVPFESGRTVLDALNYIYENYDGSLAYVYGCRYGFCGSCALKVNEEPVLICRELATKEMRLEPLDNFPVVRDLVVNREGFEGKIRGIQPFLQRINLPEKEPEVLRPSQFEAFRLVSRCIGCLGCTSSCPVVSEDMYEYSGPALMVELARYAFDPRDEGDRVTTAYFEGLYNCTGCGKCKEVCPYEIDIPKLVIEKIKEEAVLKNIKPPALDKEIDLIASTEKAYSAPMERTFLNQIPSLIDVDKPAASVALFVGCFINAVHSLQNSGRAAIEVLKKNKIRVVVPKEQVCCGRPLIEIGERRKIDDIVRKNVLLFEKTKVKEVVSLCSGCSFTLKEEYPSIFNRLEGREPAFTAYDLTEFIAKRTKLFAGKMKRLNLKVSYHDPCVLNRNQQISKEPRKIIKSIPGVQFVEIQEADRCCGGGGLIRLSNYKLAKAIGRRKVKTFQDTGAEVIVTPCPICILQIKENLRREGIRGIKTIHLTELLENAYG